MVESWIFKSIPNTQQRKSENVHFKTTRSTIKKKTEVFTGLAPDRFPSCSACLIAVLLFDINFVQFLKWHVPARNKTFLKLKFFCFYSHIITFMCAIILCKIIIFTDSFYADSALSIRRFRSCFDKNLQTPKGPTTISPVPHYHTLVRFKFECDYTNELLTLHFAQQIQPKTLAVEMHVTDIPDDQIAKKWNSICPEICYMESCFILVQIKYSHEWVHNFFKGRIALWANRWSEKFNLIRVQQQMRSILIHL